MSVSTSTSVSPLGLLNSFSGAVQKNLAVLFTAQALNTGATTVSTSLSSIIIVHITGADKLSGLPSTINFFMSAIAAFWAGRLMAAKGRRIGLSLGYAIGFVGAALAATMALEKNLIGFLIGGAMVGVANGAVQQGRYAVADMVGAKVRGTVMGWILTGSVLGSIASNIISSYVRAYAKGINLPEIEFGWYLGSAFMLIAGIIVWFFLRPDPKDLALQTSNSFGAQFDDLWARCHGDVDGLDATSCRSLGHRATHDHNFNHFACFWHVWFFLAHRTTCRPLGSPHDHHAWRVATCRLGLYRHFCHASARDGV
jgi:MFS family permease